MSSTSSRHVDGEPSHASIGANLVVLCGEKKKKLCRGHGGAPIGACDACDGSQSTCRLDVELIPEPS
eukprot:5598804-Prymnesium_polylepis.1